MSKLKPAVGNKKKTKKPDFIEVDEPTIPEVLPKMAEGEVKEVIKEVEKSAPVDKKETAAERDQRLITSVVKAMMGEMMPAFAAMTRSQSSVGAREGGRPVRRFKQCRTCRQAGPGDGPPCNGEHSKMVVFPQKYPQFGKYFQGCIINGIRYLSSNRRELVEVPTACVSSIMKTINDFEENEWQTAMGRQGGEDLGSFNEGGRGNTYREGTQGWR